MKMKLMQFIGTRNKTDFVLYFSHVLTSLEKRVLVVDNTRNEWYRHGYARLKDDQRLFDFQGIDLLCGTTNWLEIEEALQQAGETTVSYDVIITDVDNTEILKQEWPEFDERFYIGDFDRAHQLRDVDLLKTLFNITDNMELKRITFESNYNLTDSYFESILKEDVQWRSMNYQFAYDDLGEKLRAYMQYEQDIPFKQLNKQYKELLSEIISGLLDLHIKDVTDAVKPTFFKFHKKVKKTSTKILEGANA